MGRNLSDPEHGNWLLKRRTEGNKVYYYLAKSYYDSTGMKQEFKGKADLLDIAKLGGFRDICGVISSLKSKLINTLHLLNLRNYPRLKGEKLERTLVIVFDLIPLALAITLRREGKKKCKEAMQQGALKAVGDLRWEEKEEEGHDLSGGMERWESFDFVELFDTIPFAMFVMSIGGEKGERILAEIRKMRGDQDLNKFDKMITLSKIFEKVEEAPPPPITDVVYSDLLAVRKIDEKGRVTIPKEERKLWNIQKGDKVALIRTRKGIEINLSIQSLNQSKLTKPWKEPDIEYLARKAKKLSEFFQAFLFHFLDETQTTLEKIKKYRTDFEKTALTFRDIPKENRYIIFSTFGENFLLVRWMIHILSNPEILHK